MKIKIEVEIDTVADRAELDELMAIVAELKDKYEQLKAVQVPKQNG
jgi:phage terminase large subunit-like protein